MSSRMVSSRRVSLFPLTIREAPDSITFSALTEKQADDLTLAFAKAGFYVKTWDTTDADIKYCVNVKVQEIEA